MKPERSPQLQAALSAFARATPYKNKLVAAVEKVRPLVPYPVCATCPASFFYETDELMGFCKVRKDDIWGMGARPVLACSEREELLEANDG